MRRVSCSCINKTSAIQNGFVQCLDETRITFGSYGQINIYELNNISECNEIGFPQCDNSTCYNFHTLNSTKKHAATSYLSCTSFCSGQKYCKKPAFKCSDNRYIFLDHFCDGIKDCIDGSDEIVNKPGFKCNRCVLPLDNLYDGIPQCVDSSDLCLFTNNEFCFECLDKRLLISSQQVCDGVYDCYDLSDECLCDTYFDAEMCVNRFKSNNSACFDTDRLATSHSLFKIHLTNSLNSKKKRTVTCQTKYDSVQANLCDGRPECEDFSDECKCSNPPSFCNDSCPYNSTMLGVRYCDGVEDPVWIYFNDSRCPKGFDELQCPKRFKCNASGNVSIDVFQVCDGKPDCDDSSDENNCLPKNNRAMFSSDAKMISEPAFEAAFWIIGFIVLFGNAYVIVDTAKFLNQQNEFDAFVFQRVIILNISIADFIMGIYLITIVAHNQAFSGIYGSMDREWRSSSKCSVIGSLSVISSEASCFFMVVLTAFRLNNISKPFASLISSLRPWKLSLVAVWLLSICFGIIPITSVAPSYFVDSISFSSKFHQNGTIDIAKLKQFMCRYALLSNTTVKDYGNEVESIKMFLKNNLPDSLPVRVFGYYGETSVCMPRFYLDHGEPSWEYTLSLITVNLLCFIFIVVGYVIIYWLSNKSSSKEQSNRSKQEAVKMQKRIARIIATDFCCWVPICIMAYVDHEIDFPTSVYQINAVFLLPLNSALNPFLFSSLLDKLIEFCGARLPKRCRTDSSAV